MQEHDDAIKRIERYAELKQFVAKLALDDLLTLGPLVDDAKANLLGYRFHEQRVKPKEVAVEVASLEIRSRGFTTSVIIDGNPLERILTLVLTADWSSGYTWELHTRQMIPTRGGQKPA